MSGVSRKSWACRVREIPDGRTLSECVEGVIREEAGWMREHLEALVGSGMDTGPIKPEYVADMCKAWDCDGRGDETGAELYRARWRRQWKGRCRMPAPLEHISVRYDVKP